MKCAKSSYGDRQNAVLAHHWLSDPIRNLIRRSWEAMSLELRSERILNVLVSPVLGLDGFRVQIEAHHPDPGDLLDSASSTLLPERTDHNDESWQLLCGLLTRGLIAGGEARRRAAKRLDVLRSQNQLTPRSLAGNPDSPQAVVFLTSIIDELVSIATYYVHYHVISDWNTSVLRSTKPGKWLSGQTSRGCRQSESVIIS